MKSKEVVHSYFEALAKGDISGAFSYFTPDVKWHQPGNHKFSGIKNSPEEIVKMIGAMMYDTAGSLVVKPTGTSMESNNLVACPVRFTATKGTQNMDMVGIDLFEVKEGKIKQVWLFSDDQQKEDIFWQD